MVRERSLSDQGKGQTGSENLPAALTMEFTAVAQFVVRNASDFIFLRKGVMGASAWSSAQVFRKTCFQ